MKMYFLLKMGIFQPAMLVGLPGSIRKAFLGNKRCPSSLVTCLCLLYLFVSLVGRYHVKHVVGQLETHESCGRWNFGSKFGYLKSRSPIVQ